MRLLQKETFLRIYRKTISHLKIREDILSSMSSNYDVGPTIVWTEDAADLSIFTKDCPDFIGFEAPFNNPHSPKYLTKLLKKMRMKKGTILIKESAPTDSMHIPVHFCGYRVNSDGILTIFDPSWHIEDRGIYSTTAFYDSLDAFGISYQHAEYERSHHWQSVLPNDVFCQTWTLQWLMSEYDSPSSSGSGTKFLCRSGFPLPKTRKEAARYIAKYIKHLSTIVIKNLDVYMLVFPTYKLESNDPWIVFEAIIQYKQLEKYIYETY